jgi:hypothetical protein
MACLSEPAPESSVLVTRKVVALDKTGIISNTTKTHNRFSFMIGEVI